MKVIELFAGVGGFRIGLEKASFNDFETVFFNQWEPAFKTQFAYDCYIYNYGLKNIEPNLIKYTNTDIRQIPKNELPDFDLLVAGFPCQDYSVAGPKSSKGIEGKKGVLWWDIRSTLEAKNPKYVLLENVDRLLKSPTSQKGRDFGIILKCFDELGYDVQWRVINAAEYNKPQKRRRVFIFAYKRTLNYALLNYNFFDNSFPCKYIEPKNEYKDLRNLNLTEVSNSFKFSFEKSGSLKNGIITTCKIETPNIENNNRTLGNLLISTNDNSYYIIDETTWIETKGAKKKERTSKDGYTYIYSEGGCPYPDKENIPARTILTSEGIPSRTSHVVLDPITRKKRILLPIETERIQTFPDDWTKYGLTKEGKIYTLSNRQRYFCMGNALVTELITDMGKELIKISKLEK